jgi:hypothetical protein
MSYNQHDLLVNNYLPTRHLLEQPLFSDCAGPLALSPADRVKMMYARARKVILTYSKAFNCNSTMYQLNYDPRIYPG